MLLLCEWSTHIGSIAESLFWRLCDCCRPWGFIRAAPSLESCKVHQWEFTSATNPPLLEMRCLLLIMQVKWFPRTPVWGRNWQQAAAVRDNAIRPTVQVCRRGGCARAEVCVEQVNDSVGAYEYVCSTPQPLCTHEGKTNITSWPGFCQNCGVIWLVEDFQNIVLSWVAKKFYASRGSAA
jgi:hypothetical protein